MSTGLDVRGTFTLTTPGADAMLVFRWDALVLEFAVRGRSTEFFSGYASGVGRAGAWPDGGAPARFGASSTVGGRERR